MPPGIIASYSDLLHAAGRTMREVPRPVVCIQGLGFVGAAMAVAVASARDARGEPCFNVAGVDLPAGRGRQRIETINSGRFPVESADAKLCEAFAEAHARGNLVATGDPGAYAIADVTVVDIHLDLGARDGRPFVNFAPFQAAMRQLGSRMRPGTLVIVETTVPPGTCRQVAAPALAEALQARGLPPDALLLAHAYERVMPGEHYLDSIVNFWRVYAADTEAAAEACERFLSKVVNTREFPLTRLASTLASETAKILENSYRAATIAFMEEWGRFAEAIGIDLFEVIAAIRQRPTHSNIRQPGFGVGGYCLTKDPLFASVSAKQLFGLQGLAFPFNERAIAANEAMPLVTLEHVRKLLGGTLRGKRLLLLGVSYRSDVGDTRYSPSEILYRAATKAGAEVACHDPLVSHWPEIGIDIPVTLPSPHGLDAVVLAVPHRTYREQDWVAWAAGQRPAVFDANHVLDNGTLERLRRAGCRVGAIGRGLWV